MKVFVYLRYLSLLLVLNSFNFKSSAQLHPSFTGNDDKSSVSEGFHFMQDVTAGRNKSLIDLPEEIWAPVIGYEGFYEVSTYSRIRAVERIDCMGQHRKLRIRIQSFDKDGYYISSLSKDRVRQMVRPHRLSAAIWIPNPLNLPEVNHKNGIKSDCHISNLEWSTNLDNILHATEIGLRKYAGEGNPSGKLTSEQATEIYLSTTSWSELSKKFSISKSAIGHIKCGYTWTSVTGHKNSRK